MVSYGIKYIGSYKRFSNNTTTVTILQKNYVGTTTTLVFQEEPVVINYRMDPKNIYQPTVGSGCSIKIMAQPLAMLDLFSEDPQEFKVIIYNGTTGGTVTWQGFVNTEIFSEDYSLTKNVPLSIECNDGMNVLQNTKYMTTGNTNYRLTVTLREVFTNVLSKLNLNYTYIYTSNDITISGTTTDFFNNLTIPQENFFDESLVAMNCRDVLNSIVGGLGLQMRLRGQNIYIIDPINLHTTSKGRRYDVSPVLGANQTSVTLGGYLNISNNEIDWWETGMKLDIIPSYGEISVEYDPYNYVDDSYDFNKEKNIRTYGAFYNEGYRYPYSGDHYVNTGVTFNGWDNLTTGRTGNSIGFKEKVDDTPEYAIWLHKTQRIIIHTLECSNITQDDNLQLKVSCDVWVHTKTSDNNIYAEGTPVTVQQVYLPFAVSIGGQWWGKDNNWYVMPSDIYSHPLEVREEGISRYQVTESVINDTWTPCSITIPLGKGPASEDFLQGQILIVLNDTLYGLYPQHIWPSPLNANNIHNIYIKNLKADFVNKKTGEIIGNKGVKTTFKINSEITNKEGLSFKTTAGAGTYGHSRAALKTNLQAVPGLNIKGLSRVGETGNILYNTSYLLLQSAISEYQKPRVVLTGTLSVSPLRMDTELKLIRDTTYLNSSLRIFTGTTPSFYITNYTYSDRDEKMNVEALELTATRVSLPELAGVIDTEIYDILIGLNQTTGTISFSGLKNNTIALEVRLTAAAYSSYINCSPTPSGSASYTFTINGTPINDSVYASGATEEDQNVSDVSATTYVFTDITSGSTCSFVCDVTNGNDYCGDSAGQVGIELLSLTVTVGNDNIAIDQTKNQFITIEDIT